MINWFYDKKEIDDISKFPEDTYGFVYKITHLPTGKSYIGKKVLYYERNKRLGKKELEILREERSIKGLRGRVPTKKKVTTESDWKTYWGSSKELNELRKEENEDKFHKEIICFAKNKKLLTYYELKYLCVYGVLENPKLYWNDNILGKFFTKDFE